MGSSAQPQSAGNVSSSSPEHRAIYKPSHGEVIAAIAHLTQKLKKALMSSLEATGSVDRLKFEDTHGDVTAKHLACMNEVFKNGHLHFKVEMDDRRIYLVKLAAPKPQ